MSRYGYNFKEFREPDIGNQLTAIACEPVSGERRSYFSKYPLMGSDTAAPVHASVEENQTQDLTEKANLRKEKK